MDHAGEMSNAKLVKLLEQEPHTPLDEAVEAALVGMGCLAGGGERLFAIRG